MASRQASLSEPSGLMGRLRMAATARPSCGQVEMHILVSPSSMKVALLLLKSKPKATGMAKLNSYQKPVTTAIKLLLPRSAIFLRFSTAKSWVSKVAQLSHQHRCMSLTLWCEDKDILAEGLVRCVATPLIRQDPLYACLTSGLDELHVSVVWRHTS